MKFLNTKKLNMYVLNLYASYNICLLLYVFSLVAIPISAKECEDVSNHPNIKLLPQDCGIGLNDTLSRRISNGNVTAHGSYPWMALVVIKKVLAAGGISQRVCSGTLINERYVLTAYSCFSFEGELTTAKIYLRLYQKGRLDIINCDVKNCAQPPLVVDVDEFVFNEDLAIKDGGHSLALLRLKKKVHYEEFIKPVCLPLSCDKRNFDYVGIIGTILGWEHKGVLRNGLEKTALEKSQMIVLARDTCQEQWGHEVKILESMMCAGWPGGRAACGSDKGGPLLTETYLEGGLHLQWTQIGIIYDGVCYRAISKPDLPTVFTRLRDHIPYILKNIRE